MSSTRLTLFLLRDVDESFDALVGDVSFTALPLREDSGINGDFYYSSRPSTPPSWVRFVDPVVDGQLTSITSSSSSGLLVLNTSDHFFALSFGYGRSFLDPSKIERMFGLKVALNLIDPSQIRSMDTKTFEDIVVSRTTQASKSSELPTFGVDISRDILRAVTGEPRDRSVAKRLSGSDALVVNLPIKAIDIPGKCDEFLLAFQDDSYKESFEWIDQLAIVNDPTLVSRLDEALVEQLKRADAAASHLAMPEPIEWEDVDSFRITGTQRKEYDDLDLVEYLDELGSGADDFTLDLLKSRRVSVRFGRSDSFEGRWSLYQCLISEQRLDDALYVLIEGRWFAVSDSLVHEVDSYADSVATPTANLPAFMPKETEPKYNERVAASFPEMFLRLDAQIRRPGGAASGIEFCDLLSANGEFVHVKRKSRSSTLSHLFAQGSVSAQTFLSDQAYRDQVRGLIATKAPDHESNWLALVPSSVDEIARSDYTVSYVVLADSQKTGTDWLPFFSKLNLMQHGRQLRNLGFNVSISRVGSE